ncbi:hypothetical protein [Agromyces sp. H66]|uniref:hypothetical protein n=1 Tax=Agromyces sp. H66 TaxID=2529859 RepID=UPI0010AAA61E|nr:hypothetical protein [Agromyces sp. H66]
MTRRLSLRPVAAAGWCLALPVASVFVLTACTTSPSGEAAAAPTDPTPAVVSIEMPDLAPYPEPDPPLTEAESETRRLEDADLLWQGVLASHPNAVRPEVAFEGHVTDENRIEVLRACYEAAGLQIDEGRTSGNPDGPPDAIGWSGSGEADVVAGYACAVAHPTKITNPGPNDAELEWIYDYLTDFYAPCLEANGIEVPESPGRDNWVETWPGYVWFPSAGDDERFWEPEMDAALREACPDPDTYVRTVLQPTG